MKTVLKWIHIAWDFVGDFIFGLYLAAGGKTDDDNQEAK